MQVLEYHPFKKKVSVQEFIFSIYWLQQIQEESKNIKIIMKTINSTPGTTQTPDPLLWGTFLIPQSYLHKIRLTSKGYDDCCAHCRAHYRTNNKMYIYKHKWLKSVYDTNFSEINSLIFIPCADGTLITYRNNVDICPSTVQVFHYFQLIFIQDRMMPFPSRLLGLCT